MERVARARQRRGLRPAWIGARLGNRPGAPGDTPPVRQVRLPGRQWKEKPGDVRRIGNPWKGFRGGVRLERPHTSGIFFPRTARKAQGCEAGRKAPVPCKSHPHYHGARSHAGQMRRPKQHKSRRMHMVEHGFWSQEACHLAHHRTTSCTCLRYYI